MKIRGFSLIELLTVMILLAIMSFVAIPHFNDRKPFDTRGFYDESVAMLQYAQRMALAKRRTVCVALTATTITLTVHSVAGSVAACDNATPLTGPLGENPFVRTAPSGVTLATTPATSSFRFDALGRPNFAAQLDVQVVGDTTYDIFIEPETGYVHGTI